MLVDDEWGAAADTLADASSVLDWWRLAGLDVVVGEEPRDWLQRAPAPSSPAAIDGSAAIAPVPHAPALPATLPEFRSWLLADAEPCLGPPAARLAPLGDPASGLMVLVDMPEAEDAASGALLSGPAGALLDRMLAAIGRGRDRAYLAGVIPARAPAGRIDRGSIDRLGEIARHHAALAAPRRLLLMGDEACRAVLGLPLAAARGRLHPLNHGNGNAAAIASFHPRFLLQRPACKADTWRDLRLLNEGLR